MRRHILLVNVDPYFCFSMELALKKKGYLVSQVADAKNAVEHITRKLSAHPVPDLILLDLDLPEFSGVEIVQLTCRQAEAIPILAFSGYFDARQYLELIQLGCREILFKPIKEQLLLEKIAEALPGDWLR